MIEIKPLPCPFCGASELEVVDVVDQWVLCNECEATGPLCANEAEAIAAWNRRHEEKTDE